MPFITPCYTEIDIYIYIYISFVSCMYTSKWMAYIYMNMICYICTMGYMAFSTINISFFFKTRKRLFLHTKTNGCLPSQLQVVHMSTRTDWVTFWMVWHKLVCWKRLNINITNKRQNEQYKILESEIRSIVKVVDYIIANKDE